MKLHVQKSPTEYDATKIRRAYKALAKFSLDTGNPLESIGPEATTHLVAFWNYLAPLFRRTYVEAAERELKANLEFCALTTDQQQDVLEKRWTDYVRTHKILDSPHAWALEGDKKK